MVHSRVEFLLGDILEPKVTWQRKFVCFDTMFLIMKTMIKYVLGMYIMTDITYMINKHSNNNIYIYLLRKWTQILRIKCVQLWRSDQHFWFVTMFLIMRTMTKYLLGVYIMTDITYIINKHSKNNIFIYPLQKCT